MPCAFESCDRVHLLWTRRSRGVLHFPSIEFKSGGTFKLCFCDHTRLDQPCAKPEDFAIEVRGQQGSRVHSEEMSRRQHTLDIE